MEHLQSKVLLLVEGQWTEPKIFKQLENIKWHKDAKLEIVHLGTNIYSLYKAIENLNIDFGNDSTSTLEALKMILKNNNRQNDLLKLQGKFPYIYLLFDFEYQDNLYENKKDILLKMMNYFSDETENGLLLINYPMIESFKDYKEPLPDKNYKDLSINTTLVKDNKYKSIVNDRGTVKNYSKYTILDFELIFLQNLMKANYIVNDYYAIPDYNQFIDFVVGKSILEKQFEIINNSQHIKILCTSIFIFVYYYGKDYYNYIIDTYSHLS